MENNKKNTNGLPDLLKKVDFLLVNNNTVSYLKQNQGFQEIIKNELYVLSHWSAKDQTNADAVAKAISKYNELVPTNKYEAKPTATFEEEEDYIDYAKYLDTYVKNILKVNLEKIDKPEEIKFEQPKTEAINSNPNASAAFMGGMNIDPTSPSITIPNPMLQRQAQENLQKKILNNEVYLYTSKPKHIPVFKIIFAVGISLFSIFLIIASIFMLLINGKNSGYYYVDGTPAYYSTLWTAIFGLLFALLFIWMLLSPIIKSIRIHKKTKTKISDMEKYGVNTFNLVTTIIFGIFYGLFMVWPTMGLGSVFQYYGKLIDQIGYIFYAPWVMGLAVSVGIVLAGCGIMLVSGVVLGATKPKEDKAKFQQLLTDEFNKIVSGSNQPSTPIDLSDKEVKN